MPIICSTCYWAGRGGYDTWVCGYFASDPPCNPHGDCENYEARPNPSIKPTLPTSVRLLPAALMEYPYLYAWKNNEKRQTLYGRACRVIVRGKMNSCIVEFDNGQREVTSRNAIRKRPLRAAQPPRAGDGAATSVENSDGQTPRA